LAGAGLSEVQLTAFHSTKDVACGRIIKGGCFISRNHSNALFASRAPGMSVQAARADHLQLNHLAGNHGSLLFLRQGNNLLSAKTFWPDY
jgi:hypothetical protein